MNRPASPEAVLFEDRLGEVRGAVAGEQRTRRHAAHHESQAIKPVRQTCAAQQRNFDVFRREYDDERPHEALGQTTPA